MRFPQWYARWNRFATNKLVRLWAGWMPSMGILEHRGRTSGTPYRTPLLVFPIPDGVAILVGYGPGTQWRKNLVAAGSATLQRNGRRYTVTSPRSSTKKAAAGSVRWPYRPLYAVVPFDEAILLTTAPAT
ncbi:nitroreductase family deazaflavin-dependent oxidoreductase [Gordonia alkanivorans]|uniref:Nitroreductase family deazaflavin-dependent oxidoreductase n=1 Tax=Gordonia alkanivorans NBRC 16433 TaxID=1027371 RepID=F9W240_9ACTN|nr:nitroreductase family deazaflavin-dependent oxidoreductase [Gordonia alkanivorans]GAA14900.1 hypothetical protein GOALK_118_00180 [Gordonia alkanivorans NBRC 16433]